MTEITCVKHQAQKRGFNKDKYYSELWVFPGKSRLLDKRKTYLLTERKTKASARWVL